MAPASSHETCALFYLSGIKMAAPCPVPRTLYCRIKMATPQFLTWSILDPGGVSLHNQNFWQSESYFATPGSWQLKGLLGLKVGRVATLYKLTTEREDFKTSVDSILPLPLPF